MEKKYQVFVSSTYKDLTKERQEVMQALLEQECIPVGMELFPAADDGQWTLIKRLIDDCDYYIVIIGGRYGTVSDIGISYTQMEYEYALSIGIPIIGFLHENPGQITSDKTERDSELITRLDEFKNLVQRKLCKYYNSPADLGGLVSRSLIRLIKDKPRAGWIKATLLPSEDTTKELLQLRKQIEILNKEINILNTHAPAGTEDLSQGGDPYVIRYSSTDMWDSYGKDEYGIGEFVSTWNEIFSVISPLLIDEENQNRIVLALNTFIKKQIKEIEIETGIIEKRGLIQIEKGISKECFLTILVQLKALGLIAKSNKKRSLTDSYTYWTLTPYGENLMTKLVAIKK